MISTIYYSLLTGEMVNAVKYDGKNSATVCNVIDLPEFDFKKHAWPPGLWFVKSGKNSFETMEDGVFKAAYCSSSIFAYRGLYMSNKIGNRIRVAEYNGCNINHIKAVFGDESVRGYKYQRVFVLVGKNRLTHDLQNGQIVYSDVGSENLYVSTLSEISQSYSIEENFDETRPVDTECINRHGEHVITLPPPNPGSKFEIKCNDGCPVNVVRPEEFKHTFGTKCVGYDDSDSNEIKDIKLKFGSVIDFLKEKQPSMKVGESVYSVDAAIHGIIMACHTSINVLKQIK